MRLFLRVLSGIWTRYGAATSRFFAIYEPFRVGGGGFVVRSISMNKKGKITPTHQPEALIKWGY
ncbi:ubiquitin--protein ligase [Escherichia coli]|nr:ubiquitin--protein ligase [Escherichia coli]TFY42122.1 ubiquitin--protein ligase [Escherichia coli]